MYTRAIARKAVISLSERSSECFRSRGGTRPHSSGRGCEVGVEAARVRRGEIEREDRASPCSRRIADRRTLGFGESPRNRQAESVPAYVGRHAWWAIKRLEDPISL